MQPIFVSYRREDSAYVAASIADRLRRQFGDKSVFMDVDNIPLGSDFRRYINDVISKCSVVLVLIGDEWLVNKRQERRLDEETDFVRLEIQAALDRDIPVVPVLIEHAQMPAPAELPTSIRELAYRNAAEVRSGRDLTTHLDKLCIGVGDLIDDALRLPTGDPKGEAIFNEPAQPTPAGNDYDGLAVGNRSRLVRWTVGCTKAVANTPRRITAATLRGMAGASRSTGSVVHKTCTAANAGLRWLLGSAKNAAWRVYQFFAVMLSPVGRLLRKPAALALVATGVLLALAMPTIKGWVSSQLWHVENSPTPEKVEPSALQNKTPDIAEVKTSAAQHPDKLVPAEGLVEQNNKETSTSTLITTELVGELGQHKPLKEFLATIDQVEVGNPGALTTHKESFTSRLSLETEDGQVLKSFTKINGHNVIEVTQPDGSKERFTTRPTQEKRVLIESFTADGKPRDSIEYASWEAVKSVQPVTMRRYEDYTAQLKQLKNMPTLDGDWPLIGGALKIPDGFTLDEPPSSSETLINALVSKAVLSHSKAKGSQALNEFADAEEHYHLAIELARQAYGDTHPWTAQLNFELGMMLLIDVGDLPSSKRAFGNAVVILRELEEDSEFNNELMRDHISTCVTAYFLAHYWEQVRAVQEDERETVSASTPKPLDHITCYLLKDYNRGKIQPYLDGIVRCYVALEYSCGRDQEEMSGELVRYGLSPEEAKLAVVTFLGNPPGHIRVASQSDKTTTHQ